MGKCKCTVVLGLPQVFMHFGSIKHVKIEATMSLMLDLPTLVLLHKSVASRGIFERGAANVFVHEFDSLSDNWLNELRSALETLISEVS